MSYELTKEVNKAPLASNIILLVAVAFILFILTLIFIYFNNTRYLVEMRQLAETSETGSKKMQLFNEFAELARGRTRNTLQILETEDVFEQDELNQQLESYAGKFAAVRERLDRMPFPDEDFELYKSAFEWVPKILPQQRKAVELVMHDSNQEEARRLIYEIVLPGQQAIIDIFSELTRREQQHIRENAEQVNQSVLSINRDNNYLFAFVLILFSLLSAGVIFRIFKVQKHLASAYESLEEKVRERTADLKVARDQAMNANKAKSEFLSSMSHELRTPLNAILGFSQLLEMDDLNESQKDSVSEIYKGGKHLLELINEVLDLAKIEAGRMEISMAEVELSAVLEEVRGLAAAIAEKYGIEISFEEGCGGYVSADYTRLKQVFINLISNAIKYNRADGRVDVYCENRGERVRVCIRDTGPGIAPEQRAGLFEPFNRLGAEGSDVEGTGIGMMITSQFAEMMGAELDFDSVVGQGSTFWVEMDLLEQGEDQQQSRSMDEPGAVSDYSGKQLVLYIEDNPANMKFMQQVLARQENYHMLAAYTPSEGIELATSKLPNLILLDINLPEMDGYEVLKILKDDRRTMNIPVIAVTASAMAEHVARGEASDFFEYITKPVDIQKLLQAMQAAIGQCE